jgi:SNF2 family DNA or RNA helicase
MLVPFTLTSSSKTIGQPKELTMKLTTYQKAMLFRCLSIEEQRESFGIMADAPGTGKTAVILALLLASKKIYKGEQTIIVLPQNIIQQWCDEIVKFCGNSLSFTVMKNYADISNIYNVDYFEEVKKYDILIVASFILPMISPIFLQSEYRVKRVIYDEIDTIETVINTLTIKNDLDKKMRETVKGKAVLYEEAQTEGAISQMTWFISASIINLIDDKGDFHIGNVSLSQQQFMNKLVKCSPEFIEAHSLLKFNTPKETVIKSKCIIDDYTDFVSIQTLDYANSLSFNSVHGEYIQKTAESDDDILPLMVEDYLHHIEHYRTLLQDLPESSMNVNYMNEINHQKALHEKNMKAYQGILDTLLRTFGVAATPNIQTTLQSFRDIYSKKVEAIPVEEKKLSKIVSFFKNIKNTDAKVLLFSDFTTGFNRVMKELEAMEVKFTDLGKGNIKEINQAICDFKTGDTQVLFVDSSSQGCGMNLENATHVCFLHKTIDTLYDQIIGRALRPGRTGPLEVVQFLNANEIL